MANVTYSFKDTQAAIFSPTGGFSLTSSTGNGVAEEGITITPKNDKTDTVYGADGSWQHSLIASNGATFTIRLLKNSNVNSLLDDLYNVQKTSATTWGQTIVTIVTSVGDTIVLSGVAFQKLPTINYSLKAGMLEWEFTAGEIQTKLAGTV